MHHRRPKHDAKSLTPTHYREGNAIIACLPSKIKEEYTIERELLEETYAAVGHLKNCMMLLDDLTDDLNKPVSKTARSLIAAMLGFLDQTENKLEPLVMGDVNSIAKRP